MKAISLKLILFATMMFATSALVKAQDDVEGCKDHPQFNRMANYYLSDCKELEFGSMKFPVGVPDPKNEN